MKREQIISKLRRMSIKEGDLLTVSFFGIEITGEIIDVTDSGKIILIGPVKNMDKIPYDEITKITKAENQLKLRNRI